MLHFIDVTRKDRTKEARKIAEIIRTAIQAVPHNHPLFVFIINLWNRLLCCSSDTLLAF